MTTNSNLDVISPFIHLPETVKLTNCARSSLIKYSELGQFPPMVRLLGNRIAFIRADVQSWIDCRLTQSTGRAK